MKNILVILLLFASALLLNSCSKSSPQPTCEEGGTEVTSWLKFISPFSISDSKRLCHLRKEKAETLQEDLKAQ